MIKKLIKKLIPLYGLKSEINSLKKMINLNDLKSDSDSIKTISYNSQIEQRNLFFHYQLLRKQHLPLPDFNNTGFRVFSQTDEDGLLLYIFSQIGFTNKICLDMAFDNPYGANVTNLICNWGFTGLLIEGSSLEASETFFKSHPDTYIYPPKLVQSWITAENVNDLCTENGIKGEIDLFSLDMDGMDYWVWKALDAISPRVVVCEYANFIDADKSITVPYKPDFNIFDINIDFCGASLAAFVKLGKQKGYRLIGCNKYGFNAFFLRNDLGADVFPEIEAKDCLKHPQATDGIKNRQPKILNLPWVEV
ncbi:MAG: hypothetical protein PHD97_03010 [Bacteroidales bacterium]|nr:hypothetical protein [Bacteroidales bacterium]